MIARAVVILALGLIASATVAAEPAFRRHAAVKALGYDPEAVDICKTYQRTVLPDIVTPENAMEVFLRKVGEDAAERAACPKLAKPESLSAPTKDAMSASSCLAVANAAGGPITERVSEMMGTDHPDVVAGYVDGVARALEPIRDECKDAGDEAWAKVAAQAALFENRARSIRESRVCTLWRLAVDREAKAATAIGGTKGRAAGLAHLRVQGGAALAGAHNYCSADASAGVLDANVELTKMLIGSMPEK